MHNLETVETATYLVSHQDQTFSFSK